MRKIKEVKGVAFVNSEKDEDENKLVFVVFGDRAPLYDLALGAVASYESLGNKPVPRMTEGVWSPFEFLPNPWENGVLNIARMPFD